MCEKEMTGILSLIAKHKLYSLFIAVAIYEGCLANQGVSLHDEGSFMYAYSHIFDDPESVEFQMMYYNGLLAGGLWNKFFGNFGYLGFRIFHIILIEFISIMAYVTLKPYTHNRWTLPFGIFLAIFSCGTGPYIIHHNTITAALAILIVYFIMRALKQESYTYMLIAGAIIGTNIFTRLPNIAQCGLIFILIPFVIYTGSYLKGLKLLLAAVVGVLLGVSVELSVIHLLDHDNLFYDNIIYGINSSDAADSPHNIRVMALLYIKQYVSILIRIISLLFLPITILIAKKANISKTLYNIILLCVFIIGISFIAYKIHDTMLYIYGFCTTSILYAIYKQYTDSQKVYILILSLLVMYIIPLGSDWGIGNTGDSAIFLSFPLAVDSACSYVSKFTGESRKIITVYILTLFAIFASYESAFIMTHCDFDDGPRWEKRWSVCDVHLNTLTTEERAKRLNILLPILRKYIKSTDYVLDYPGYPTLSYVLNCHSYAGTPWTWTYDSKSLHQHICRAENTIEQLPVVVRSKGQTLGDFTQYDPDWNNCHAIETYAHHNGSIKIVQEFCKRHCYKVAWEDNLFQILVPGKHK